MWPRIGWDINSYKAFLHYTDFRFDALLFPAALAVLVTIAQVLRMVEIESYIRKNGSSSR